MEFVSQILIPKYPNAELMNMSNFDSFAVMVAKQMHLQYVPDEAYLLLVKGSLPTYSVSHRSLMKSSLMATTAAFSQAKAQICCFLEKN